MPRYNYTARDQDGRIVTGNIIADNQEQLAERLNQRGYYIVNVDVEKDDVSKGDILERFRKVTLRDYLFLTIHLHHAVDAGIPLLRAINAIAGEIKSLKLKTALKQVGIELQGGSSFSEALKKFPKIFNDFFVNMVHAGEISGQLGYVLQQIAIHIEKKANFRSKIVASLIYPCILLFVSLGIVLFLMTFIMPKFIELFEESNVKLPPATMILVFMSDFFTKYWYIPTSITVGSVLLFRTYSTREAGKVKIDEIKLKLPLIGKLLSKVYVTNFLRTLSTLYNSGIPILASLRIVEGTVGNKVYANAIKKIVEFVKEGQGISEPLYMTKLFPSETLMMVSAGEETGKLGDMLQKNADLFEEDIEYELRNIISIVEPMIIVFMGVFVAFVAFSILMPVFRLSRMR